MSFATRDGVPRNTVPRRVTIRLRPNEFPHGLIYTVDDATRQPEYLHCVRRQGRYDRFGQANFSCKIQKVSFPGRLFPGNIVQPIVESAPGCSPSTQRKTQIFAKIMNKRDRSNTANLLSHVITNTF